MSATPYVFEHKKNFNTSQWEKAPYLELCIFEVFFSNRKVELG